LGIGAERPRSLVGGERRSHSLYLTQWNFQSIIISFWLECSKIADSFPFAAATSQAFATSKRADISRACEKKRTP
jgi:hypothetical protein